MCCTSNPHTARTRTCTAPLKVVLLLQPTHLRAIDEDFYSPLSHSRPQFNNMHPELVPFKAELSGRGCSNANQSAHGVAGYNGPIIHSTCTCPTRGENPLNDVKTF